MGKKNKNKNPSQGSSPPATTSSPPPTASSPPLAFTFTSQLTDTNTLQQHQPILPSALLSDLTPPLRLRDQPSQFPIATSAQDRAAAESQASHETLRLPSQRGGRG